MFGNHGRAEQRAIQATPWGVWQGDNVGATWAGNNVDSSNAMQLLTVYGCVRLIADQISTLPIDVYRKSGDNRVKEATPPWLDFPVVGLHRSAWLTQVVTSLLLDGNAYWARMRSPEGRLVELPVLDASKVQVMRENGRRVFKINGQVADIEIDHIAGLMGPGSETGISPVEMARQSIGGGMAAQEYSARFFGQGATMSGVIEVPGMLPPGGPDVAGSGAALAKEFGRRHSGKNKAHLPAVLTGGATWKPTSVTPEQAQFLETRGFTAAEIAGQMFLLDPTDLGIPMPSGSSLTYANLEQRNLRRVQVALLPWIVRIEAALSGLLPAPRYVKFNLEGLLRGDTLSRYQAYQIGVQTGFLLNPEIRVIEDMPPLPADATPPAQQMTLPLGA